VAGRRTLTPSVVFGTDDSIGTWLCTGGWAVNG
jgi:hypothetical protein